MKRAIRAFWADQRGATAIEYGLIAAGISIGLISVVNGLGSKISSSFVAISSSLK